MRRVVVTGMGVVSALGQTAAAHCEGLSEGRSGIGPLDITDIDRLTVKIGGQAKDYDGTARFSRSELSLLDRCTQMALTAADEAVTAAGLELTEEESFRAATVIGTALTGMGTVDDAYRTVFQDGKNRVHPFVVPRLMASAPCSHISMKHGLKGPAFTVTTACSSANHAMGQAFQMVRAGLADVALTGGAEAPLVFGVMKAWEGLRVMTRDACRPFSADRNGMVQGEGAAIYVLETLERAQARGATILAEITGFGMSADAGDIVQPSADGAGRAIRGALMDAGMDASEVGYINAHGTGTAANDRTECQAVRAVFGAAADGVMISSTKSMHGHCLGGAGAVEMAAVIHALKNGVISPTINHSEPDPDCDLDVVPNVAREVAVKAALSNSFAFGGLNAVIAARRFEG
ncbi:beta-ketoacyl-[acyl-carrier-protein] synthase family protein [Rhodovulum sp. DZ06]|uniref:beta-ketoacyl-[acyl-carrier-protein] synthase family protein n=1 Tax=Rhodovulum sp. DZ06 TaxID=3425126 RepID=UPI003D336B9F